MPHRSIRAAGLIAACLAACKAFAQTSAQAPVPCLPGDPALACKLQRAQALLNNLAVILTVILIVVVAAVVLIWRRVRAHDRREEARRGPDRVIR